jgi:hypothetical protein
VATPMADRVARGADALRCNICCANQSAKTALVVLFVTMSSACAGTYAPHYTRESAAAAGCEQEAVIVTAVDEDSTPGRSKWRMWCSHHEYLCVKPRSAAANSASDVYCTEVATKNQHVSLGRGH